MAVTAPIGSDLLQAFWASDPGAIADSAAVWREARETGPVVRIGPSYLLTRYEDVHAAIREPERYSNETLHRGSKADYTRQTLKGASLEAYEEMAPFQDLFIASIDDPEHARMRRIVHRAFTPRRIKTLADAAQRYVDEIVGELAAQGGVVDLVQLAYRVPLLIIGDLVGVPLEDQTQVKAWSDLWVTNHKVEDDRVQIAAGAQREFRAYIERMIEQHQSSNDPNDLVSALLGAQHEEVLSHEEFAALLFVFVLAGHETTTNLIATGTLELLRQREQWQALCDDAELAPGATDEMLRFVSPAQWITRRTTEDVEIAGSEIPAETHIAIGLASANRDPDMFDNPDQIDVSRPNASQHVALGHGIHFCLGATLARLEGAIVFRTLSQRYPELELATETPEWTGSATFRALKSLPVRLGPARQASS